MSILLAPLSAGATGTEPVGTAGITPERQRIAGRVLLVDDEPAVGEFMQDLLEDRGLTVRAFNNSVDACVRFSDDPDRYDLVVVDQTMPRMTGMEVAQQLLELRPGMPVILYTGYTDEISEEQVLSAGIRALVNKPVDTRRLHDLIWGLLSGTAV